MELYLLSCHNLRAYAERILPMLPEQRRLSCMRSGSDLSLGAGLLLSCILHIQRDEDLIFGSHGKPYLKAGKPAFSLSHSGCHVLLGVSDSPVGVDMEQKGRTVTTAVQKRMCLPSEKELDPLTVFTRKECAMKLTGLGFSLPLLEIDTTKAYIWHNKAYRFFTTEREGYLISVLSAEETLPEIQLVAPEELL